ncbi:SCAPER family protein [Megaselia abdita]
MKSHFRNVEMRQVIEEGRDAKNLLVCQINNKPPACPKSPILMTAQIKKTPPFQKQKSRVRSASTGRDKKSELQARYWALLFGNLQRAVNEIYQTVECYENLSSCQETILVLENYIRDFRALAEWFRVSWDYESTPQLQRPNSLAWEIRKSNPVPRTRAKSLTSPIVSGKSSPIFSGKSSPAEDKMSPRKQHFKPLDFTQRGNTRVNVTELFSSKNSLGRKSTDSIHKSQEFRKLSPLPKEQFEDLKINNFDYQVPEKFDQYAQTDLEDEHLTLAEIREKMRKQEQGEETEDTAESDSSVICQPTAAEIITNKLNQMETEQLEAQISNKLPTNPDSIVVIKPVPPPAVKAMNSPVKYSSVVSRNPVPRRTVPSTRPVTAAVPTKAAPRRFPTSRPTPKPQTARNPPPPSRNPPSNVANRISFRSKTIIDMGRQVPIKSGSAKNSKEDVGSSSSTLKASNDNVSERSVTERRSEPKQLPSDTNDGWLTVKNRRRPSLHWANRFNQPTGYASLPTLALMNEKEKEKEKTKEDKKKVALTKEKEKAPPVKKVVKAKVNSLPSRPTSKIVPPVKQPPPIKPQNQNLIKRQKSDLTGLKITSLHKEFMKSEKSNLKLDRKSTPALVELDEVKSSIEEDDDDEEDLQGDDKINIKIQTNRDFSKTIGELYESLSSLPNGIRNEILSSCPEECDEKEEIENEENQKKLLLEEEELERQIRELQNTEIDVDTETDETDIEVMIDHDDSSEKPFIPDDDAVFVDDENLSLEMRCQALLSDMSWREREEALATLQAYVSRHPGRAQELHQKLSSPSRRRSLQETLKKYQAKQARAAAKREDLQKEKGQKIQQLLDRVEAVKQAKSHLIEQRRLKMEERLQRAAENRTQYLKNIVEKAHDEEKKLKEINFIKNIEAQNKRLDLLESSKEHEGRLQDIEEERKKRSEEKAAKEAAVERRRQQLEMERQLRLERMNETRLEREQRIGKLQEQNRKHREAMAREKARDREERLLALQVQQQQTAEELQRKILLKQKESARRHEENIEQIRQRALELTIPSRNVEEDKDGADGEDGAGDGDNMSSTVSDVSREITRGFKKKIKKLKQRMALSAEQYIKDLDPIPIHMKRESQVPKFLNLVTKGGGTQGLERQLGQLLRIMAKANITDFQCFWLMDGLGILTNVLVQGMEVNTEISKKSMVLAIQLYRNSCSLCPQIARHSILGNSLSNLFDVLFQALQLPEEKSPQIPVELSTELMLACTVGLTPSNAKKHSHPKVMERLPDLISYAVASGLIEILSRRCMKIRESVEVHQSVVLSLLATIGLLTKVIDVCPPGSSDQTKFFSAAKSTELFGSLSMLYSAVVPIGECIPPRTISLAAATFNLIVSMAVLDLSVFQEIVSVESLSLKLLDVITILLKYCGNQCNNNDNSETQAVIVDLIATIGFFCANNKGNQNLLASEQSSIIIKSLTKLPKNFNIVVYPCLVTIIYKNEEARKSIAREFNVDFLDEYSKSEKAKKNRLISVLNPDIT